MAATSEHQELLKLLFTDELTHLYNRRYLREQIPKYLAQAERKGLPVALFMFDMDNFKGINDNYGHHTGDEALVHFSKTLVATFQRSGIPIRFAGDEFVVVAVNVEREKAKQFGDAVGQKLAESPLSVSDTSLQLQCSIGIALFPTNAQSLDTLFEKADEALYIAKKQGKGRTFVYPESGKLLTPEKLDSVLAAPPIVGRKEILQFIENHLSPKGDDQKFAFMFAGDGMGKSRIIKNASLLCGVNLSYHLECKGYPSWQTEPYGAAFGAISVLFERRQDISKEVFDKIDDKYKTFLKPRIFAWDTKEIASVEEEESPDNVVLFEALMSVLLILKEKGEGAVLFDDIEYVDSPTLQLLDALFSEKEGNKIHLLASIKARDLVEVDERILDILSSMKAIPKLCSIEKIQLHTLSLENINELVSLVFDWESFKPEVVTELLNRSGGNPLFIIETISFLLQSGKIQAIGDKWDLSSVTPKDIPNTLDELLHQRLMRLDEEEVNVLKLASVMGERINPHQLAEMSGLKFQQIMDILGDARRALLIEDTPNPEEFVFAHKLDRSVFYAQLTDDEKDHYHGLAADIEQKYNEGALERVVGRLAYHYQNAGDLDKAARLFSSFKEQMEAVLISEGTRRILQKRIITSTMAKESPLEEDDLISAIETARALKVAMQNLRLYPRENENVKKSVERFETSLHKFLVEKTEALSISLTAETMLFNGQPPPPNTTDPRLTQELYSSLSSYGLQGVLFIRGITNEEIFDFLDVFILKPEKVSSHWDEIVDEKKLEHILPDRKIFVAVGESKIALDEKQLLAQTMGDQTNESDDGVLSPSAITDEQIDRIQAFILDFKKDKNELIVALQSGAVGNVEIQRLIDLLEQTDNIGQITPQLTQTQKDRSQPTEERYADVLPDIELVKQSETDVNLAFQDLSGDDTMTRARAAAWLLKQEPEKVIGAGFSVICSDLPIRTRKLAAAVIAKMGNQASTAFLDKISPGLSTPVLKSFLDVGDLFLDNPNLLSKLREIVLSGSVELLSKTMSFLRNIPGKNVNQIIVDLFDRAKGKMKMDILGLIAERKISEACPILTDHLKPQKMWEKDTNIQMQIQICKTLGMLRTTETQDSLIRVALVPKPWTFMKPKPESIRAAAAWALRQFPKTDKIEKVLEQLKKDKAPVVRKAAGA